MFISPLHVVVSVIIVACKFVPIYVFAIWVDEVTVLSVRVIVLLL